MKQRNLIKSQIIKAWNKSIAEDYCNQRINSERSLQASFWSHLNQILSNNRRLFIEPSISIKLNDGVKKVIPDIVVCNTKQVISVIELKYRPRGQPYYKKDIASLSLVSENREYISISNDRFRGSEKDATEYTFSKSVLFVWAGIHNRVKSGDNFLYSAGYDSLSDCYLQLHAETVKDEPPRVFTRK